MPALKSLSRQQYERFTANVITLIKMDRIISLPEWVLHRLLVKELKPHFEGPQQLRIRFKRVDAVAEQAATLLSTIARFGHEDKAQQRLAFDIGIAALNLRSKQAPEFQAEEDVNFS